MIKFLRPLAALLFAGLVPACGASQQQGPPKLSVVGFSPGAVAAPDGNVPLESQIFIFFSSPLNAGTITTSNFLLSPLGGSTIPVTLSYNALFAEVAITPSSLLTSGTQYVVTVTTTVTDTAGDAFDGFQIGFTSAGLAFSDTTPVSFGGITGATGNGVGTIQVSWAPATGATPNMYYDVYVAGVSGSQDFSLSFNAPGSITNPSTSANLIGLTSGVTYFIVLRAHDGFGNQDRNIVQMSAMAP